MVIRRLERTEMDVPEWSQVLSYWMDQVSPFVGHQLEYETVQVEVSRRVGHGMVPDRSHLKGWVLYDWWPRVGWEDHQREYQSLGDLAQQDRWSRYAGRRGLHQSSRVLYRYLVEERHLDKVAALLLWMSVHDSQVCEQRCNVGLSVQQSILDSGLGDFPKWHWNSLSLPEHAGGMWGVELSVRDWSGVIGRACLDLSLSFAGWKLVRIEGV